MPHNPTCSEDFVNPGSDFEALTQLLPAQQRKSYRSGLRQIIIEPAGGLGRKSTVYGLNGHRLHYIKSLFKVTYKSTIQVSRNFHALSTKTVENSDTCD